MSGDTRAICVFFRIEAPPVSWLWRFNSAFEILCAAFPPWRRIETIRRAGQWHAPQTSSPYSRAAATDFHRLPVRGVSCDCLRDRDNLRIRLRRAVKAPREMAALIQTCFKCSRAALIIPAQNHARPRPRTQIHLQRRFEHFFEQSPLVHLRRSSNPQRLAVVQQHDAV